jgi:hypothetical protein
MNQLIPPPELAPPSVKHLPISKRVELWVDLVAAAEEFLLAGLKRKAGPQGDLRMAYQTWFSRQMGEREARQIQFLENLSRREASRGN